MKWIREHKEIEMNVRDLKNGGPVVTLSSLPGPSLCT
jgi:hypothetical protein